MQSRLVLVFVAGAIAGYAGHRTPAIPYITLTSAAPQPQPVPVPLPLPVPVPAAVPVAVPVADPDPVPVPVADLVPPADADDTPTGEIAGLVTEASTHDPLAGVTVIANALPLEHSLTAITNDTGRYRFAELPSASYHLTFYYADVTVERDVGVGSLDPITVDVALATNGN
jgi:hypothetical protein